MREVGGDELYDFTMVYGWCAGSRFLMNAWIGAMGFKALHPCVGEDRLWALKISDICRL